MTLNDYTFLEDDLEQASLEWLEEIGYEIRNGVEFAPSGANSERKDFGEVVLENRLKFALQRINDVSDDVIDEADSRRGVIALHKQHSNRMAIYAGDYTNCL